MTALTRNPPSANYLQPTKFQVNFPRISSATYFCQSVKIPGVSVNPARQTNPFVDLYRPGEKMEYGIFDMEFIVDEDLWSWEIIHDWMRGYSFPFSFEEYKNQEKLSEITLKSSKPQYSDGKVTILSALNNPKFRIKFVDMFPISLSDINFNVMLSADKPMIATAQFRYQLYNIERV